MSLFQVTPEELAAAGGAVSRCAADIKQPESSVLGSSGAAGGTPAAGAYDALLGDLQRTLETLQTATEDLGRALGQASTNYARTEEAVSACYLPGAGP